MSTDRVTVSLPHELRQTAQEMADAQGVPFSTIVSQALTRMARSHLIDAWLADYQERNSAFTEEELQALASETGMPYIPPFGRIAAA